MAPTYTCLCHKKKEYKRLENSDETYLSASQGIQNKINQNVYIIRNNEFKLLFNKKMLFLG